MRVRICMRMQVRSFSEVIDETRKEYSLDPIRFIQYAKWFAGMATGDMGKEVTYPGGSETFHETLSWRSYSNIFCCTFTMLIAIPSAFFQRYQHNKWSDYLIRS